MVRRYAQSSIGRYFAYLVPQELSKDHRLEGYKTTVGLENFHETKSNKIDPLKALEGARGKAGRKPKGCFYLFPETLYSTCLLQAAPTSRAGRPRKVLTVKKLQAKANKKGNLANAAGRLQAKYDTLFPLLPGDEQEKFIESNKENDERPRKRARHTL